MITDFLRGAFFQKFQPPNLEANLAYILAITFWTPQLTNVNVIRLVTNYGVFFSKP